MTRNIRAIDKRIIQRKLYLPEIFVRIVVIKVCSTAVTREPDLRDKKKMVTRTALEGCRWLQYVKNVALSNFQVHLHRCRNLE